MKFNLILLCLVVLSMKGIQAQSDDALIFDLWNYWEGSNRAGWTFVEGPNGDMNGFTEEDGFSASWSDWEFGPDEQIPYPESYTVSFWWKGNFIRDNHYNVMIGNLQLASPDNVFSRNIGDIGDLGFADDDEFELTWKFMTLIVQPGLYSWYINGELAWESNDANQVAQSTPESQAVHTGRPQIWLLIHQCSFADFRIYAGIQQFATNCSGGYEYCLDVQGSTSQESAGEEEQQASGEEESAQEQQEENNAPIGTVNKSAKITFIRTYETQSNSPLQWKTKLQELQLNNIQEYGYSFWFKNDFLWKADHQYEITKANEKHGLAYLSEHENSAFETDSNGKRTLVTEYTPINTHINGSVMYVYSYLSNSSYNNLISEQYSSGVYTDSQWNFLYISYSYTSQVIYFGHKIGGGDISFSQSNNNVHQPINVENNLYFRLANTHDTHTAPSFQGYFKDVSFFYGPEGSGTFKESEAITSYLGTISNPIVTDRNVLIPLTETISEENESSSIQVSEAASYTATGVAAAPGEYSIHGYLQLNTGTDINEKKVIYQVSTKNFAQDSARAIHDIGYNTFQAYIYNSRIYFNTYNVYNPDSASSTGNEVSFAIAAEDIENDLYFYQGYSQELKSAVAYIKTYRSETGEVQTISTSLLHMRSSKFDIHIGGDADSVLPGEYSCISFQGGENAFLNNLDDLQAKAAASEECVAEGVRPSSLMGEPKSLESYNYPGNYLSEGSPSFLTDDPLSIAVFRFEDGLIGDPDTVSLRYILPSGEDDELKPNFYWRHIGGVIRETQLQDTESFRKSASFIVHQDYYIEGTVAIESANKRGFFIRHRNSVIRLEQDDGSELFQQDASWNAVTPQEGLEPSEPVLVPVYRLQNDESGVVALTISEERADAFRQLGFTDFQQPAEGEEGEASNIIGQAWTKNHDSETTAVFEYRNPTTNQLYYTITSDNIPSGFEVSQIAFYAYSRNVHGTSGVVQYLELANGSYKYTTSGTEQSSTYSNTSSYTNNGGRFWVFNDAESAQNCIDDVRYCSLLNPEPCSPGYMYRIDQDGDCVECRGEIDYYDMENGDDIAQFFTGDCRTCEGGEDSWTEDPETGVRTCIPCPFGTIGSDGVCYNHCDETLYQYLNLETNECTDCPGVVQIHTNGVADTLFECIVCENGYDLRRECQSEYNSAETFFILQPNECPGGFTQIDEYRVCSECAFSWVEGDNGIYYCQQTCDDEAHFVNEQGECAPCLNGYIYDDGQGRRRCAPNVSSDFEPITAAYNDENVDFSHEIQEEEMDDILEFGFWMWIKPQYLTPTRFDFTSAQSHHQRIAGFIFTEREGVRPGNHYRSATLRDVGGSTQQSDPFNGMGMYVKRHSDAEQSSKHIVAQGSTSNSTENEITREDFENEWILVYMAHNVNEANQIALYTYTTVTETETYSSFDDTAINMRNFKLSFHLHRNLGFENVTMGFQGTYYNVELRFGQSGIYQGSAHGVQQFLIAQDQPITNVPPVVVVTDLFNLTQPDTEVVVHELPEDVATQSFENLHGAKRYAVYGWYKATQGELITLDTMLFNLQDVADDSTTHLYGSTLRVGDMALKASLGQQHLRYTTYNVSSRGSGGGTETFINRDIAFGQTQYSTWFFVYVAFDGLNHSAWGYYKNLMTQESFFQRISDSSLWQLRSNTQFITIGKWPKESLASSQANFHGTAYNLKLQYKVICDYDDSTCVGDLADSTAPTPAPEGQCVIMYDEPDYQGPFISVCDENESYNMSVGSIYVPEGIEFTIWNQENFEGLTVVYMQSQSDIQSWDFTLLLQNKIKGVKLIKDKKYHAFMGKRNHLEANIPSKTPKQEEVVEKVAETPVEEVQQQPATKTTKKLTLKKTTTESHLRKQKKI